jgi:hypothetical protein
MAPLTSRKKLQAESVIEITVGPHAGWTSMSVAWP